MARVTCPNTKESATMTAKLAGVLLTAIKETSYRKPAREKSKDEEEGECPFGKPGDFIAVNRYKGVIKNDDDIINGFLHMEATCRHAKNSQKLEVLREDELKLATVIMEEQSGRDIVELELENKMHRERLSNPIKNFEQMECEYLRDYMDKFEGRGMVLSHDEAALKTVRTDIRELGEVTHRFVPVFVYIPGNEEIEE